MSIQKKSLISTLKTAKKANVASDAKGEKISSMRVVSQKISARSVASTRSMNLRAASVTSSKSLKARSIASTKATLKKVVE